MTASIETRGSFGPAPEKGRKTLYGRRRGRRLRAGRQRLMDEVLPRLRVSLPASGSVLDPKRLFAATVTSVWLEVGFGRGEHLAAQAAAHPEIGFIGCEPYVDGVAALLGKVSDQELANIRVYDDDARDLIAGLADDSVSGVFVLFSDPWPKKRQHKRRFITVDTLDALARIMTDGAELRLATDDPGYLSWILERTCRHEAYEWLAEGPQDWRQRPSDWPQSRYEAKALAQGRCCTYLRFRRCPRRGTQTT